MNRGKKRKAESPQIKEKKENQQRAYKKRKKKTRLRNNLGKQTKRKPTLLLNGHTRRNNHIIAKSLKRPRRKGLVYLPK